MIPMMSRISSPLVVFMLSVLCFLLAGSIMTPRLDGATAREECDFLEVADTALYSHNDLTLTDSSVEYCKQACLDETNFKCLSFDFIPSSSNCYLSRDNQFTAPEYIGSHSDSTYYQTECVNVTEIIPTYPDYTDDPIIDYSEYTNPDIYVVDYSNHTIPEQLYNATVCRYTQLGKDYMGRKQTTRSGKTCQDWGRQYPHQHGIEGSWFPEGNFDSADNYCRNPDSEPGGPWCYTTDPDVRWEYCDIPFCPYTEFTTIFNECRTDIEGRTYRGTTSKTHTGRECQYWVEQYPHEHSITWKGFPEGNKAAASNFCRNPDGEPEGPWCYTTDPETRWEYCDLPFC